MEKVKWEKCLGHAVTESYPPPDGKMRNPFDPVDTGMHISAKYAGLDVHLRIQDATNQQKLVAEVLYFEPVHAEKPKNLNEGDIVVIDRDYVCCIYDN